MSLLSASLFSPELKTDHPITITPVLDIGDENFKQESAIPSFDESVEPGSSFHGKDALSLVTEWKHTEAYDISWLKQKGATVYKLYGSMSPANRGNLLQEGITDTSTRFYPPYFSETVAYFFWISWVDGGGTERYLTDDPASLMTANEKRAFLPNPITQDHGFFPNVDGLNKELAKDFEYIRKGNRAESEMDGEPAWLYLRRHAEDRPWGIACSCTDMQNEDDSDPDYNGRQRCKYCFGTGIFGGFYPRIPIVIRYGNAPEQSFKYTKRGFELHHAFNTYSMWLPVIRTEDIVIRAVNGSRYTVTKTQQDISVRGVRLHQEFDLKQIEKNDILMELTDKAIEYGINKAKVPGYARDAFKIFG